MHVFNVRARNCPLLYSGATNADMFGARCYKCGKEAPHLAFAALGGRDPSFFCGVCYTFSIFLDCLYLDI